jgi:hypothetical protein
MHSISLQTSQWMHGFLIYCMGQLPVLFCHLCIEFASATASYGDMSHEHI